MHVVLRKNVLRVPGNSEANVLKKVSFINKWLHGHGEKNHVHKGLTIYVRLVIVTSYLRQLIVFILPIVYGTYSPIVYGT